MPIDGLSAEALDSGRSGSGGHMLATLMMAAAFALSSPTLQNPIAQYVKGDVVRLVSEPGRDPLPDSRIVAVAGDRMIADASGILVNGEPVRDVSPELLQQIARRWEQVVPPDHYFVIGERHNESSSVRYHGLIPAEKIARKLSK
jgi:signal peptidase I